MFSLFYFLHGTCTCVLNRFSHVQPFVTPWTVARQAPLSMGILQARILEWVAMPSSVDLPNPGTEPKSPTLQADFFFYHLSHQGSLPFSTVFSIHQTIRKCCFRGGSCLQSPTFAGSSWPAVLPSPLHRGQECMRGAETLAPGDPNRLKVPRD